MALTPQEVLNATESVVWIAKREGAIYGFWRSPPDPEQAPGAEAVYESDAEVQAFLAQPPRQPTAAQKLAATGLSVADLKALIAGK